MALDTVALAPETFEDELELLLCELELLFELLFELELLVFEPLLLELFVTLGFVTADIAPTEPQSCMDAVWSTPPAFVIQLESVIAPYEESTSV